MIPTLRLVAALFLLGLCGCTLAPRYSRPAPAVDAAYPQGPAYESTESKAGTVLPAPADLGWRDFLGDPRLRELVELALRNNRDLRVAVLNVEASRAALRIQTATLLPQVSATANQTRSRTPASVSRSGAVEEADYYSAGASFGWELDFFGRLRSLRRAAVEQYLASVQGRKAVEMLLVSQVAQQYLTVLACDELLAATDETLASARASYNLVKLQFETGAGSELELRQSETIVEQALANHDSQLRTRAQAENALVLLLGQPVALDLRSGLPLAQQRVLGDVPAGLPSELLTRRADVLQAEALLRAANADIGAARAAFFPVISLTGIAGSASDRLRGLFKDGASAWTFAPSMDLSLFADGANRANLEVAHVRKQIAIAQYQKTVQTAFREVADGLAARGTYDGQILSLQRLAAAQRRRLELAQLLYLNGESSYLDVLTAQVDLYDAELSLVAARLQRLANLVNLYRALGGGWLANTGDLPRSGAAR